MEQWSKTNFEKMYVFVIEEHKFASKSFELREKEHQSILFLWFKCDWIEPKFLRWSVEHSIAMRLNLIIFLLNIYRALSLARICTVIWKRIRARELQFSYYASMLLRSFIQQISVILWSKLQFCSDILFCYFVLANQIVLRCSFDTKTHFWSFSMLGFSFSTKAFYFVLNAQV
jgi:hypothetical protein